MTNHQTHRARGLATLCFAIAAILGVASGGVALAGEKPTSGWVDRGDVKIRLIAAKNGVGDDRALSLGLHMRLKPGWKTYWRQPGEAGLPPELDWAGSDNLGGVDMSWPLPKWFSAGGVNSIGYKHDVVFPLVARLAVPGRALDLKLKVDFAVCLDICLPQEAELRLTVPEGPAAPSVFAPLIERYLGWVPVPVSQAPGLSFDKPIISGPPGAATFKWEVRATEPLGAPDLFIEGPPELAFGRPGMQLHDGGRRAVFVAKVTGEGAAAATGATPLRLTLAEGRRGFDIRATPVVRPGS